MSDSRSVTRIHGPEESDQPQLPVPAARPSVAIEEPPLFDVAPFVIPSFDGQRSDKLTITFTGSISYEIGDPEGEALFAKLTLGRETELRVSGTVVSKAGRYNRSKDDVETITGFAGVKIDTLYVPAAEDLD